MLPLSTEFTEVIRRIQLVKIFCLLVKMRTTRQRHFFDECGAEGNFNSLQRVQNYKPELSVELIELEYIAESCAVPEMPVPALQWAGIDFQAIISDPTKMVRSLIAILYLKPLPLKKRKEVGSR